MLPSLDLSVIAFFVTFEPLFNQVLELGADGYVNEYIKPLNKGMIFMEPISLALTIIQMAKKVNDVGAQKITTHSVCFISNDLCSDA